MAERPSSPGANIRIGLLSPSAAIRTGLRQMLGADERLEIAIDGAVLADYSRTQEDDVDVLILTPSVLRGSSFQREIQDGAKIGVLWLTDEEPGGEFVPPHLPGQPWGVLPLDVEADTLTAAVRALYEGLSTAPPEWLEVKEHNLAREIDAARDGSEGLTPREVDVLQQLALGLTNKQIAYALGISEHTAKFHISSIYSKLGVMNRAEAVRVGVRQGWISI